MKQEIQLCLDLNIWCGDIVSKSKGKKNTPCQRLIKIVEIGRCSLGDIKLVISWSMLNRLKEAIKSANIRQNLNLNEYGIDTYINAIITYARDRPYITLGGMGVTPLDDSEDAHVLETAIAGRSKVIITRNFEDFTTKEAKKDREILNNIKIVSENEHAIYSGADWALHIIQPIPMLRWIESGQMPSTESFLLNQDLNEIILPSNNIEKISDLKNMKPLNTVLENEKSLFDESRIS